MPYTRVALPWLQRAWDDFRNSVFWNCNHRSGVLPSKQKEDGALSSLNSAPESDDAAVMPATTEMDPELQSLVDKASPFKNI